MVEPLLIILHEYEPDGEGISDNYPIAASLEEVLKVNAGPNTPAHGAPSTSSTRKAEGHTTVAAVE